MPETRPLTRSKDEKFEKLFAMKVEMKAGQARLEPKMEAGQEEMRSGQERMEQGQQKMKKGQEEMKTRMEKEQKEMRAHIESKVEGMKEYANRCIEKKTSKL
ncbi:hypothetical protein AVEN_145410-1 [Araneus ventricosus]|uniref:Uncharacterized protein n=1 Tax=Araneus ventricosus TaxID=182803 RepID=A0A4Y2H7V5_ARAVE|nr:hypothetical protein AVEN_145410-1 [Araneus ventricosus]